MIYYDHITDHEICGFTESEMSAQIMGFTGQIEADQTETAWNGRLYEKGYAPSKPVQTAKDEKHSELKDIMRHKRQNVKVNYANDTFDANEEAQSNMVVLLKAFDLGAQTVSIRSSTEETRVFDKEHCQELSLIMLSAVQEIYDQYWVLKDSLSNCETVEEVEAIKWDT